MNKLMKREERTIFQEIQGTLDEIIAQIRKLIKEGNARRLIIKNKEGKTLFQSHLTIGVAGTAFAIAVAPIISAITMFVMFVNDVSVIVEREIGPDEDEYEVAADIIEIEDEEETETNKNEKSGEAKDTDSNNDESEKTVGKE
jgi:hypothetical protein